MIVLDKTRDQIKNYFNFSIYKKLLLLEILLWFSLEASLSETGFFFAILGRGPRAFQIWKSSVVDP